MFGIKKLSRGDFAIWSWWCVQSRKLKPPMPTNHDEPKKGMRMMVCLMRTFQWGKNVYFQIILKDKSSNSLHEDIHKTIQAYIGPIWFHLVGVILEGRKWKAIKWYFGVFIWRRKCEGKLVGHEYFLHGPTKIQFPQIKEKMGEKRGKKVSHVLVGNFD